MDDQTSTEGTHMPGTRKGEELANLEDEPGREDTGTSGADRPEGTSTARMSTGINPEAEDPIDPAMPHMPPA